MNLNNEEIVISNHIPKAGGTSIIRFFEKIHGTEFCYRHEARDSKTNTHIPPIDDLSLDQRQKLKFLAGHFWYGKHRLFNKPYRYISVVRDPLEKIVSAYYFNKQSGRPDLKKEAQALSLDDYIKKRLKTTTFKSQQTKFICGSEDLSIAESILEKEYLMVCTTPQLSQGIDYLARYFGQPNIKAGWQNETKNKPSSFFIEKETMEEFQEAMHVDYTLFDLVENKFKKINCVSS